MAETEELIKIYQRLEDAGLIVIAGKKDTAELMVSHDVVPVVRCKDCKYWLKDVAGCTDSVGRCEWANYMVGAVGYCVYGERKDNG